MALDWLRHRVTGNDSGSFRKAAATLYARVLILLTAVVLYLLAVSFYGRRRLAAGIALAFGLTTLALPYTRIGMEPPLVFWTTAAFAAAYRARRVNSAGSWLLAGICAGFAGATRNPAAWVLVAPIMAYGALGLLRPRRQSSTRLLAFAVPILLAAIAAAAYNVARCDEVVCGLGQQALGHAANGGLATDKARLGFVEGLYGLLLSPGKSFFITSPIVVVGAIGLWRARGRLRAEVLTVLASGLVALAVLSPLSYWSEETYGPRYVLFLVPLVLVFAGFATNVSRRIVVLLLVLGAILQVSVLIPVGAHSPCATYVKPLVGDARFDQNTCRFVPELSDGILDVRLTFAVLRNMVGLGVTNLTYEPYVGAPGGVIERRQIRITQDRPFLFWAQRSSAANLILLLAYVLTAAGGAIALRRLLARRPVSRG
jgi:4-amino-4-deoxy-L-arabinose transferase-like glycosyltransferase